jgi:hypothetical protein
MRRVGGGLAALLVALAVGAADAAARPHYVATWVPDGFRFTDANNRSRTSSIIHYGGPGDHITVATSGGPCCTEYRTAGRPITVRGHSGRVGRLYVYDYERYTYGHYIAWEERPGVWVTVESQSQRRGLPLRPLRRIAERVGSVRDSYWRRLVIGTQRDPIDNSELPGNRRERFVKRGTANGHTWILTALVPPGFPLGWYDLRAPCDVLTYRGKRTLGLNFGCVEIPNWELVKGQIFVWGIASKRVHRVRIRPLFGDGSEKLVTTIRRRWLGNHSLYVAAMPRDTCHVEVVAADGSPDYGPTGPVNDKSENERC